MAYRSMSMKWHPDKNPDKDVTSIMQDINEAYAILKNEKTRERYDKEYDRFFEQFSSKPFEQAANASSCSYEYTYNVQDDTLKEDIAAARQYAKDLVEEFFKSFKEASQNAASGAWEGAKNYIYAGIILAIIGVVVGTCIRNSQNYSDYSKTYEDYFESLDSIDVVQEKQDEEQTFPASKFHVPQSWAYYLIAKAFSISVPNTVELRNEYDAYTQRLKGMGVACNSEVVVFQQKGLSSNSPDAYQHYCRIMIQHGVGNAGDFLRFNQIETIDYETQSFLRELVIAELGNFSLLGEPSYKWIDINEAKAIEIKYRRNGNDNNTTCCTMYLLFNYDEMVKMIISYREQEKNLWLPDLNNVIKTFKWE